MRRAKQGRATSSPEAQRTYSLVVKPCMKRTNKTFLLYACCGVLCSTGVTGCMWCSTLLEGFGTSSHTDLFARGIALNEARKMNDEVLLLAPTQIAVRLLARLLACVLAVFVCLL